MIPTQTFSPTPTPTTRPTPTPNALSYFEKGLDYYSHGKYQHATNEFTTAIWLDADYAPNYGWRGYVYNLLRQYQQAIQDFDKALRLDTGNATAYAHRGIAYGRMGLDAKADADKAMACWLDKQYC